MHKDPGVSYRKRIRKEMLKALTIMCIIIALLPMVKIKAYALNNDIFYDTQQEKFAEWGIKLTGDGATDIVNVARAMVGKTGEDVDSQGNWCASFVSVCARVCDQGAADGDPIPYSTNVGGIASGILDSGGSIIYSNGDHSRMPAQGAVSNARPGDIVGYGSQAHVEIVSQVSGSAIISIGGNTGSSYHRTAKVQEDWDSRDICYIVRPNYNRISKFADVERYPTNVYLTTNSKVDLYAEPSLNSTKVSSNIPEGTLGIASEVVNNTSGKYWYKVRIGEIEGYLQGEDCGNLQPGLSAAYTNNTGFEDWTTDTGSVDFEGFGVWSHECLITEIAARILDSNGNVVRNQSGDIQERVVQTTTASFNEPRVLWDVITPKQLKNGIYHFVIDCRVQAYTTDGRSITRTTFDPIRAHDDWFEVHSGSKSSSTVKFDANGGQVREDEKFVENGTAIGGMPVPLLNGQVFDGWYTSKTDGEMVSEAYVINGNMTLYAHWSIPREEFCNVLFVLIEDQVTESQEVAYGEKAVQPDSPRREGFWFGGWYTDNTYTDRFIFDTEITSDIAVYAKWILPDLELPGNVQAIYDEAFEGDAFNFALISGQNLAVIGYRAFADCSNLEYIYIPESVEFINPTAFDGTSDNLTILGKSGSCVETFAQENSIHFIALS